MKSNFDRLQQVFSDVNEGEDVLKSLRDNVDTETKKLINLALLQMGQVRAVLWQIDGSLARGKGV